MSTPSTEAAASPRLMTFASAGWVLLLTGILSVVIVVMTMGPALKKFRERPPGDQLYVCSACGGAGGTPIDGFLRQHTVQQLADQPSVRLDEFGVHLRDIELARTTGQLRQAAEACEDGRWRMPTIDAQINLRSVLEPIGPVAVFG